MLIVERLFPASELSALGYYDDSRVVRSPAKKRRLNSDSSLLSLRSRDSGYGSDEQDIIQDFEEPDQNRQRSHGDQVDPPANILQLVDDYQNQINGAPVDAQLMQKYFKSMHPQDRSRYSFPRPNSRSVKLQRQKRRHVSVGDQSPSLSESPALSPDDITTPRSEQSQNETEQVNTNLDSDAVTKLSNRIFDGIRITSDERDLLHSLLPCAEDEEDQDNKVKYFQPLCNERGVANAEGGFEATNIDFDKFFDIDEASGHGL